MRSAAHHVRGFTLVEVLVALLVMSLMAVMAWQGVDGIVRTREVSGERVERVMRLNTVLAQWETDLTSIEETQVVPALSFDGSSLRLTRRAEAGVQVVSWSLRSGQWYRWAGPVVTRSQLLQESWMRSLQLIANDPGQLAVVRGVIDWQLYFYRGNGWSNAQSSDDLAPAAPAVPPGQRQGQGQGRVPDGAQPVAQRVQLPSGVRVVLTFGEGSGLTGALTRDLRLGPQTP